MGDIIQLTWWENILALVIALLILSIGTWVMVTAFYWLTLWPEISLVEVLMRQWEYLKMLKIYPT